MPASVVEFRPDDDQTFAVRLAYEAHDADFGMLVVDIRGDGLACEAATLSARGDGLDRFLASLADDWRGWDGVRTWNSLEHGLTIEATHEGARVQLLFVLRRDHQSDAWQVRAPIRIAPGESLARITAASAALRGG